MEQPEQYVHVAPLGAERDRIVQPAIEYQADKVILLDYLPHAGNLRNIHAGVKDDLDDAGINYEAVHVEMDDLYAGIAAVSEVIKEYSNETVQVNISSGDKVTAVAATLACMVSGDATPYYVNPETGGSVSPGAGPAQGMKDVETIPLYPIERPTDEQLAVMEFIDRSEKELKVDDDRVSDDIVPNYKKKKLYQFGEENKLPFMENYEGSTPQGKSKRLEGHIINPLETKGFIATKEQGVSTRVYLTDDGKNTLRAFKHIAESVCDYDS